MWIRRVIILALGVGVVTLIGWVGFTGGPRSTRPSSLTRMVRDLTGREVNVPLEPGRVLSLCTSATDTILRLEQGHRLLAMDEYSRIVPGTENIPVVARGSAISREQVIERGIDLAFVWWYQDDAVTVLEQLRIPCVRISNVRLSEVNELIRFIGECLNCIPAATRLVDALPIVTTEPEPSTSVYLELYGPFKTIGRECYINDLLEQAGARNIVQGAEGGLLLSAEQLIQANPSIILFIDEFASVETIASRAGLSRLEAVRTGRIHSLDRRWLIAGAGWAEAVNQIRQAIDGSSTPRATTSFAGS